MFAVCVCGRASAVAKRIQKTSFIGGLFSFKKMCKWSHDCIFLIFCCYVKRICWIKKTLTWIVYFKADFYLSFIICWLYQNKVACGRSVHPKIISSVFTYKHDKKNLMLFFAHNILRLLHDINRDDLHWSFGCCHRRKLQLIYVAISSNYSGTIKANKYLLIMPVKPKWPRARKRILFCFNYRVTFNWYFVYAEPPFTKQCQCIFSWWKRLAEMEPRPPPTTFTHMSPLYTCFKYDIIYYAVRTTHNAKFQFWF